MRRTLAILGLALGLVVAGAGVSQARAAPAAGLTAFRSDAELYAFMRGEPAPPPSNEAGPSAVTEVLIVEDDPSPARPIDADGTATGPEQGATVRVRGDLVVILRRGRLFTISLAQGRLRVVDSIEVHPGDRDYAYQDDRQILLVGDRVVVLSDSYLDTVDVRRFRLSETGRLSFEDVSQLSNIKPSLYESYFARAVGRSLVFFSHPSVNFGGDPLRDFPDLRRGLGGADRVGFEPTTHARDVYPGVDASRVPEDADAGQFDAVTRCDATAAVMTCATSGVLSPFAGRAYLSDTAAYVWADVNAWARDKDEDEAARGPGSLIYRIPFDGGRPQAVALRGSAHDQFSFQEDPKAGMLNVLVRSVTKRDALLAPAFDKDAVALLRVPLSEFGDGAQEVAAGRYRILPKPPWPPESPFYFFFNRFVGDHVVYGIERRRLPTDKFEALTVAPVAGGEATKIYMPDRTWRIDSLGDDALAVGLTEVGEHEHLFMHFRALDLSSDATARRGDALVRLVGPDESPPRAGYYFRPDPQSPSGTSGLLGFALAPTNVFEHKPGDLMSVVFLRLDNARFSPFGALSVEIPVTDPNCEGDACPSWFEGPRPLFINGRIFALIGYDLIEGRETAGGVKEIARLNFAPAKAALGKAPSGLPPASRSNPKP